MKVYKTQMEAELKVK